MQKIIITENIKEWKLNLQDVSILSPQEYIGSQEIANKWNVSIINLCRSYQYQSTGYYISLLAEARGHRSMPEISAMLDINFPNLAREDAENFDKIIQQDLGKITLTDKVEFNIYFGYTRDKELARIGKLLFNLFQVPIQKVTFQKKEKWQLQVLKPINLKDLTSEQNEVFNTSVEKFFAGKSSIDPSYKRKKFDLAILVNPESTYPPSDAKAMERFIKAADKIGFNTELITKNDYGKLKEFDALFIRDTTSVNHYTYRFSRKAEYEGIAVIDDPISIMKCSNKVYLKELLESKNIRTPKSVIIQKSTAAKNPAYEKLEFPLVLKTPDGSFSSGVKKAKNIEEYESLTREFFQNTDLMIAQEFMPTEFDWRVGILGGKVLYVCKYFMARNHWQVVNWQTGPRDMNGHVTSISVEAADPALLRLAVKATNLIGKGLYGVDIKEYNGKYYVIEINDNPSMDFGIEDKILKNKLYEIVIQHLYDMVQ